MVFKLDVEGTECGLIFVSLFDTDKVTSILEVLFSENLGSTQLV